MDNVNQVGKTLGETKSTTDYASKRKLRKIRVERGLDTFDTKVPFEFEFRTKKNETAYLSLHFRTPAPSACCGTCYCSVCEEFTNLVDITLTYGYIHGTVNIFDLDSRERITDFVEIDPDAGTLHLNTTGRLRICYIYFAGGCSDIIV